SFGEGPGIPAPSTPTAKGIKVKPRYEFVIMFTWKEPTPSDKLRPIKKYEAPAPATGFSGPGGLPGGNVPASPPAPSGGGGAGSAGGGAAGPGGKGGFFCFRSPPLPGGGGGSGFPPLPLWGRGGGGLVSGAGLLNPNPPTPLPGGGGGKKPRRWSHSHGEV